MAVQSETEVMIVPGFVAHGIHVGIKEDARKDLSLIFSKCAARAAGVFTTNAFKAAPVLIDMERLGSGVAQAIFTNSGNANAATGREGYEDALALSSSVAAALRIDEKLVLMGSTGVIGHRLPMGKIQDGIGNLVAGLHDRGIPDAQEAIMTTDRFPKAAIRKGVVGGREITVCGIAKGAGMIEPNMATLLAYVMTDANIESGALDAVFRSTVDKTFNSISVDGCMSTNDTALILANGVAGNTPIGRVSRSRAVFSEMLFAVMFDLSRAMVRDGEGATKVIEISVEGARSYREAKRVAYAVARSNLVKAAFFGGDPNWGRIISAAGSVGIPLPVDAVAVYFEELPIFLRGRGIADDQRRLAEIMGQETVRVRIDLGMGKKTWRVSASDLSFEYVRINAHYHT